MTAYPTITVWQPWATLIAGGYKPFEFRKWCAPPAYQGKRIAIHAGARRPQRDEIRQLLHQLQTGAAATGVKRDGADLLERFFMNPSLLPLSCVVCTAMLGVPIRNEELAAAMGVNWVNDSDRTEHSNWGWPLSEISPLEPPVHARGALGFFQVSL